MSHVTPGPASPTWKNPSPLVPPLKLAVRLYHAKWIHSHRGLPCSNNGISSSAGNSRTPSPSSAPTPPSTAGSIEVREILDLYRQVYEDLLLVPVVPGVTSEKEKLAGSRYTTTLEGFIPTFGRGFQAATSHCLGKSVSKPEMFNVFVEDPVNKSKHYIWQNSWGSLDKGDWRDGDGVIVPCGITAKTSAEPRVNLNNACKKLAQMSREADVRAKADLRDGYPLGHKVSLRLEIASKPDPTTRRKKETLTVRRDTGAKNPVPLDNIGSSISSILETIQAGVFATTKKTLGARQDGHGMERRGPPLDAKKSIVIPWCGDEAYEGDVRDRNGQFPTITADRLEPRLSFPKGLLLRLARSHNQRPQRAAGSGQPIKHQAEGSHYPTSPFYQVSGFCCKERATYNTALCATCSSQPISTTLALLRIRPQPSFQHTSLMHQDLTIAASNFEWRLSIRRLQRRTTVNDMPTDKPRRRLDQDVSWRMGMRQI
ncbi:hypothetical protein BKA70DRAFT_1437154 [Coprinopsis sp. MPI-PUGE-AT-0042]|nr:hypothetical protein BKA70DRAFT_1437154 [Coprinopsis sp. MPI-PUGE-AT-0042]